MHGAQPYCSPAMRAECTPSDSIVLPAPQSIVRQCHIRAPTRPLHRDFEFPDRLQAVPCPSRPIETLGLERPAQYWMTLMIGEWPYYRCDHTRLLVTLILEILKPGAAHCATPMALDIVESPLNVNGKKFRRNCQPSIDSKRLRRPICVIGLRRPLSSYHLMSADAQVNPAPKAPNITRLPSLISPCCRASSKAMGIDAADVFP